MYLYTVFWGKVAIVKEIPDDDSAWEQLFTVDETGIRSKSCGIIGHKSFIPAYEFPDDKTALLWFKLGYGG